MAEPNQAIEAFDTPTPATPKGRALPLIPRRGSTSTVDTYRHETINRQWYEEREARQNSVLTEQFAANPYPSAGEYADNPLGNWDHLNEAKLGPREEVLPEGALGWLDTGEANWGDGIAGHWKKLRYNFLRKEPFTGGEETEDRSIATRFNQAGASMMDILTESDFSFLNDGLDKGEISSTYSLLFNGVLQSGGVAFGTLTTLIKDGWQALEGGDLTKADNLGERVGNFLSGAVRVVGAGLDTAGFAFQELDRAVKEKLTGPSIMAMDHVVTSTYEKGTWERDWHEWFRNLGAFGLLPAFALAQRHAIAGDVNTQDFVDFKKEVRLNREQYGSRIVYSMWKNASLGAEYDRRFRANEDPRVLAIELMNPGAEMVGEILFNPADWLLGAAGKLRAGRRLSSASARITVTHGDELADAVRALEKLGDTSDIQTIANAENRLIDAIRGQFDGLRNADEALAGKRGPATLTAGGKRNELNNAANSVLQIASAATGGDPDKLMQFVDALAHLADPDAARIARGLSLMNDLAAQGVKIPPSLYLSEYGQKASLLMREIVLSADGLKLDASTLEKLLDGAESVEDLANAFGSKMDDVLQGMYPNIQEQGAAAAKYQELISAGKMDDAAEFLVKNRLANQPPSRFLAAVNVAHEGAQRFLYRPAGAIQGVLYMGLNPVYRVYNRWGNFMPAWVDTGVATGMKVLAGMSPTGAIADIEKYMGGAVPAGARKGIGAAGSFSGKVGDGILSYFSRKAATDEAAAAAQVMSKSIRTEMGRVLTEQHALAGLEKIEGLTPAQRATIVSLTRKNGGDAAQALEDLAKADGIDLGRTLSFVSDETHKALEDLRIYSALDEAVIGAKTLDEALEAFDDIVDQYRNFGHRAATESSILDQGADATRPRLQQMGARISADVEENIGRAAGDMTARRINENRATIAAYDAATRELEDLARRQMYTEGITKAASEGKAPSEVTNTIEDHINSIMEPIRKVTETIYDEALAKGDEFRSRTWDMSNAASDMGGPVRRKYLAELGVELPQRLTVEEFKKLLWENYRVTQDNTFALAREQIVWKNRTAAEALALSMGMNPNTPLMNVARAKVQNARLMDDAVRRSDGTAVVRLDLAEEDDIAKLMYGMDENIKVTFVDEPLKVIDPANVDAPASIALYETDAAGKTVMSINRGEWEKLSPIRRRNVLIHEYAHQIESKLDGGLTLLETTFGGDREKMANALVDYYTKPASFARTAEDKAARVAIQSLLEEHTDFARAMDGLGSMKVRDGLLDLEVMPSPSEGIAPSLARNAYETLPEVKRLVNEVKEGLRQNWGTRTGTTNLPPNSAAQLRKWLDDATMKITEGRAGAAAVAQNTRDFILHDYAKRYGIDLVLSYIYPYHFWHGRTYAKWMRRLSENPQVMARYFRYRRALEDEHAGMPDWWKYNLSLNDIPGVDIDSPFYFNLERSMNPLIGMTGVDFTDPKKRVTWYSAMIEDLNKFGPSVWTPYQLALALKYHTEGKNDAASRWAGRMWGPSRAIRDATALIDPKGKGIDIDPFIAFFSGGVGPYEEARIGRQLNALKEDGQWSMADLIDASVTRQGDAWDEAQRNAIRERAPNIFAILAPFLFGQGYKPRTQNDIQIDNFYGEMGALIGGKGNMSPEEYREKWSLLRDQYPFMDVVLLAKKSGLDKDEALAWNVLNRIPPGQSKQFAELVGLDAQTIEAFYESKGELRDMTEADQKQFIGGILELAALLELPERPTAREWEDAKSAYRAMRAQGEVQFGEDIWERVDIFWAKYTPDDRTAADQYLRANPDVKDAMDWEQLMKQSNPILGAYYTSEDKIRSFYKREMYDVAKDLFGEHVFDNWDVYDQLRNAGEYKAAAQFKKDNPEMSGYLQFRDDQLVIIERKVDALIRLIPASKPAVYRNEEPFDPNVDVPKNTDEDWISAQVQAYALGEERIRDRVDLVEIIRKDADALWPDTRKAADRYYKTAKKDPTKAASMLLGSPDLKARLAWESEKLATYQLTVQGKLLEAASPNVPDVPGSDPGSGVRQMTWVEWSALLGSSTTRLIEDSIRQGGMNSALADELEFQANRLGMSTGELEEALRRAYEEAR